MTFDDFKQNVESNLNSIGEVELQEYHYEPYSFGNGILAYRIKGRIHKFIFDGRENHLTWLISKPHQKYFRAELTEFRRFVGVEISAEEIENGLQTVHNSV